MDNRGSISSIERCESTNNSFPDLNATEDWAEKAEILLAAGLDVSIYDLEEQEGITEEDKAKGLDIGDYLIRYWKENHPEDGEKLKK